LSAHIIQFCIAGVSENFSSVQESDTYLVSKYR